MIKIILTMAITMLTLFTTNVFASLSAHPQQLKVSVVSGEKSKIVLHITNLGPSSNLSYVVSASENWIELNSTSGDVNIKDTASIELQIDAAKLKPGLNKADILIGDPHHGPITIPLEVYVNNVSDVYESSDDNSISLRAYPNPFNSAMEINFTLPESQNVDIQITDLNGLTIKSLLNEFQSAGERRLIFDGSELPSGNYFLKLKTINYSIVKKIIINK